jgi:hypothetical protein
VTRPSLTGFLVVRAGRLTAAPVTAPPLEGVWPPHPHVDLNLRYWSRISNRQSGLCPVRDRRLRSWREVSRPQQPMRVCLRCPYLGPSKNTAAGYTHASCVCGNGPSADTARCLTGFDTRVASSSWKGLGFPQRIGQRSLRSGELVDEESVRGSMPGT